MTYHYIIRWGDTLAGIARRLGLEQSDILSENPGLTKHYTLDFLPPGQIISIPDHAGNRGLNTFKPWSKPLSLRDAPYTNPLQFQSADVISAAAKRASHPDQVVIPYDNLVKFTRYELDLIFEHHLPLIYKFKLQDGPSAQEIWKKSEGSQFSMESKKDSTFDGKQVKMEVSISMVIDLAAMTLGQRMWKFADKPSVAIIKGWGEDLTAWSMPEEYYKIEASVTILNGTIVQSQPDNPILEVGLGKLTFQYQAGELTLQAGGQIEVHVSKKVSILISGDTTVVNNNGKIEFTEGQANAGFSLSF